MKVQDVLAQLRGVRPSGAGWTARCPTHDDSHNSLSVSESADGKLLYFSRQELTDWIRTGRRKTVADIGREADAYVSNKRKKG